MRAARLPAERAGSRFSCSVAGWSQRLVRLAGWRRSAAAFIAGLASVAAIAPFHAWPVLYLTLPCLIWLLDGASAQGRALQAAPDGAAPLWRRVRAAAA